MNTKPNGPIDEAIEVLQQVVDDSRGVEGLAEQALARRANAAALRLIGVRAAIARHDFDMDNVRVEAPTGDDYNDILGHLQAHDWSSTWSDEGQADTTEPKGSMAAATPMARFRVVSVDVSSEPGAESRYAAVLLLDKGDVVLQVTIRRHCYDFQSLARVESFHRPSQEWRPIARLDYTSMKTPLAIPKASVVSEEMFAIDRDELLRRALLVLGL